MMKIKRIAAQILIVAISSTILNVTCVKGVEENKFALEKVTSENDRDNDGLEDEIEGIFGADPNMKDTDNDGLDDLLEVKLSLNPAKADTNGDGKKDSEEDTDNDGLTNEEELKIGTDCNNKDTDNDGISDGDEVNIYKTSPLNEDTDEDSILDGDELKLGLNPSNQYTNGVEKDSDIKIQQVLSKSRISQVILDENPKFIPSITGAVSGLLDRKVYINSYDIAPIKNIQGLVGGAINIKSEYNSENTINLSFDCSNFLKDNKEVDVNNLVICKYKNNDYSKLETKVENNIISTDINEEGVYFIINSPEEMDTYIANMFFATPSYNMDSDYDGINDSEDIEPNNNNFSGTLKTKQVTSKVSYTMDYRNFFSSNKQYNSNIATISSLFSATTPKNNTYDGLTLNNFMKKHGLEDVKVYDLSKLYNDSDLSEAYIGHRKVTYNGVTKEIIAVAIRGTNGTVEEWGSNVDVGSTLEKGKYLDWKVESNHKGFDVAATRILRCLDEYESCCDNDVQKTYWVMGHSRGGAIANIIGARLIEDSKDVYAYTLAAPSTTTASNAEDTNKYSGIYNIINKEDFVPLLPAEKWGFKHYGKSYVDSIDSNYKEEWQKLTGIDRYRSDASGINDTVEALSKIIDNRNEAYEYDCKCHGSGKRDDITATNYGMTKNSREKAIKKIPENALPYCIIERKDGKFLSGWDFTICQQPEYFMQLLAAFMGKKINAFRFGVELDTAERYLETKIAIIKSGIMGVEQPHFNESYYILTKHI